MPRAPSSIDLKLFRSQSLNTPEKIEPNRWLRLVEELPLPPRFIASSVSLVGETTAGQWKVAERFCLEVCCLFLFAVVAVYNHSLDGSNAQKG